MPDAPDTIVLVHGFWVTPRSWEDWIAHYESRGFTVVAPAYPGLEVEVEALNADPAPIEALTVPRIIEHLEGVVKALPSAPIIIGHSAGGAFTQILLDHGFGVAGVAMSSAPTEGVRATPLSQVRSTFPVLKNPANRHKAVGFTHEQCPALERQALQVEDHHRGEGVPGSGAPHHRPGRVAGGRRLRARLGAGQRRAHRRPGGHRPVSSVTVLCRAASDR